MRFYDIHQQRLERLLLRDLFHLFLLCFLTAQTSPPLPIRRWSSWSFYHRHTGIIINIHLELANKRQRYANDDLTDKATTHFLYVMFYLCNCSTRITNNLHYEHQLLYMYSNITSTVCRSIVVIVFVVVNGSSSLLSACSSVYLSTTSSSSGTTPWA